MNDFFSEITKKSVLSKNLWNDRYFYFIQERCKYRPVCFETTK